MAHIESCSSTTIVITDRDVVETRDAFRIQKRVQEAQRRILRFEVCIV